jgi:predicted CXXCH cytochrome family protein
MKRLSLAFLAALLGPAPALAAPGQVAGSKHDLSVSGPGPIKAVSETEVCIFCHVSHGSRENLSSRPDPAAGHRPYESTTLATRPGAPDGATRVCLSCHDGTIAVGRTVKKDIAMSPAAPGGRIPPGRRSNLGTDLRTTHPVSFAPAPSSRVRSPAPHDDVRLDRAGRMQCTSCHDPHRELGTPEGKFLVKESRRSELCLSCHDALATEVPGSSHATSGASFGAAQGNDEGFASVSDAGCAACHVPHGAEPRGRLLRAGAGGDDAACLRCHGTSVTRHDVGRDLAKPSSHAVGGAGVHDAAEGRGGRGPPLPEVSAAAPRHAVCADCHDPHAAGPRPGGGPGGVLAGVWGIDAGGRRVEEVRYEHEICFKCHADSANKPQARGPVGAAVPRRAVVEANLRRVFDGSGPSYHPVVVPVRTPGAPSLLSPWGPGSTITCGDCHASDSGPGAGGSGPRGPHGSVYEHLLERSYSTADLTTESRSSYALCYKCHDRDVVLTDRSDFPLHRRHVVDERTPCSACHAAHGVSSQAGTPETNAHLVDFDVSIVKPGPAGRREYRTLGPRSGTCTLACHGSTHDGRGY